MDRRSFLKMLVGGGAAALAAPVLAKAAAVVRPAPVLETVHYPFTFFHPFSLDMETPNVTFDVMKDFFIPNSGKFIPFDPGFLMHQFRLSLEPQTRYDALKKFLDGMFFDITVDNRKMMEGPVWMLGGGDCRFPGGVFPEPIARQHTNVISIFALDHVSISLEGPHDWIPPKGINGVILLDGIRTVKVERKPKTGTLADFL